MILTLIIATHACMLTSIRSSTPCRYTFDANRTLSYHIAHNLNDLTFNLRIFLLFFTKFYYFYEVFVFIFTL